MKSEQVGELTPTLYSCIGSTATRLQSDFLGHNGYQRQAAARGLLAELRKHAGRNPQDDPLSIETVLLTLSPPLPEQLLGKGDAPSSAERAAFLALTYFALHMQSAKGECHDRSRPFGQAAGLLYRDGHSESLKPRFDSILLAISPRARNTHIRSMITLLRSAEIGFDYAGFARDLRSLEFPKSRPGILMRWGRDFANGAIRRTSNNTK